MASQSEEIRQHLENFTTVITKTLDNVVQHTAKQAEKNRDDIEETKQGLSKLEIIVENYIRTSSAHSEKIDRAIEKVLESLSSQTMQQSQLAMEYQRLEYDRTESEARVKALWSKLDDMQDSCKINKEETNKEINSINQRINKIYIVATTIAVGGTVVANAVKFFLDVSKLAGS